MLPSAGLEIAIAGGYWPSEDEPREALIDASDHRLVWVDVALRAALR